MHTIDHSVQQMETLKLLMKSARVIQTRPIGPPYDDVSNVQRSIDAAKRHRSKDSGCSCASPSWNQLEEACD
jgi:hypothetical protein